MGGTNPNPETPDVTKPKTEVAALSRRVVLIGGASAAVAGATLLGCGEGEGQLLDDLYPVHPLDEPGDVEMPQQFPPDASTPYSDPLVLYGQSVISPTSGGGPNTDALSNPDDLDMDLLEVRWRVYTLSQTTNLAVGITGLGLGVKMDLGSLPIVDADVPVSGFGSTRDTDEPVQTAAIVGGYGIYTVPPSENLIAVPNYYRWRPKYPLLIPGGTVLTPVYSHLGQAALPTVVDTLYICRQRPPGQRRPDSVKVPWVGSYNSESFDNLTAQAAAQDASSESDLFNPFAVPLEVTRLTGDIGFAQPQVAGGTLYTPAYEWNREHRFRLGKVTIRSKRGGELARVQTPFNTLFPYEWRVWDIPGSWHMTPGEYYKVQLSVAAVDYTPTVMGPVQFMIALQGFRDVPIADFIAAAFAKPEAS